MNPSEGHNNKSKGTKHNSTLTETIRSAEKNKKKNPPGVSIPPEKEMSPPQLG